MNLISAYPAYQESGAEWMGPVPAAWTIKALKYLVTATNAGEVIDRSYWGGEKELLYTCALEPFYCDYDRFNPIRKTSDRDLLLTRNGTPYVHKPVRGSIYTNVVQRVSLIENLDRDFMAISLQSAAHNLRGYGVSIESLNYEIWKELRLPIPSLIEQRAIAAFLDRETGKIDALVAEQERLIALLTEKRQAVISQAVTKGLDASAPMKDSGVAWLGQVPSHWGVERARHVFIERDERSDGGDETLLTVSHLTGVTPRSEKTVYMFEAETNDGYKLCFPGDLVINTLWAWMGAMGVTSLAGLISPAYHVYTPRGALDSAYVNAVARMPEFARESSRWSKGVWSSRLRLYPAEFFQIQMPVPPLSEQRDIALLIDDVTTRFEALTGQARRAIALLRERRAALISAAVTGKIDVRPMVAAESGTLAA